MPMMDELIAEAGRQLKICNSCRYCEGYCAVFPALERRSVFEAGDVTSLANLCHDCRACFYACMYAPPHEFGVNPPAVLGAIRRVSYDAYISRPRWPARLGRRMAGRGPAEPRTVHRPAGPGNGRGRTWRELTVAAVLVGVLIIALVALTEGIGALWAPRPPAGSPYGVIPYPALLVTVALPSAWSVTLLLRAAGRYWRDTHGPLRDLADPRALGRAAARAASLRYLRGGGEDCPYPQDAPSPARRRLHAAVSWGFTACFAATVSAAVMQDFLGVPPPYPLLSAPVLLGTGGGIAMVAGCTGLIALKRRSDPVPAPGAAVAGFALLLGLGALAVTGLLTLLLRGTGAFGLVLVIHLTTIAVCIAVAPYTTFPHFIYRYLALAHDTLADRSAPSARQGD
jgi:citrate/tricarballylate utilization protein